MSFFASTRAILAYLLAALFGPIPGALALLRLPSYVVGIQECLFRAGSSSDPAVFL